MNLRSARRMFGRSPTTSRPMAEWRWNDVLDADSLSDQLDGLLDAGLGGVFIRPGEGLPPDTYLGKEWFDAMGSVARRTRRRRGSMWIAEDFASPATRQVVANLIEDSPDFAAHTLALDDLSPRETELPIPDDAIAAFSVFAEGPLDRTGTTRDVLRTEPIDLTDSTLPANRRVLVFRRVQHPDQLNAMDRSATMAFLERTHGRYQSALKRYFGNTLGLCLLLNAGPALSAGRLPWDEELPTLFQEIRGYDLLRELPKLYFDLDGFERVRHDYWSLVDEMVREGLITPFASWCEERRIAGGCETNAAHTPGRSAAGFASLDFAIVRDTVAHDAAHPSPGNLRDDLVALKTAQSVRRQLGKSGVIRIWEDRAGPSLDSMIAEHASNAAIGTNYASYPAAMASYRYGRKEQHGSALGLGGAWRYRNAAFDAMSRTTWMLNQGESTADVLVLHPLSSQRVLFRAGDSENVSPHSRHRRLQQSVCELAGALLSRQIDFDIADEDMLSVRGTANRQELALRKRGYRHVVLPSCVNLRSTTFGLLQDFTMGGGSLLIAGTAPRFVDGERSKALDRFFEEYGEHVEQGSELGNFAQLCARLSRLGARTVEASGNAEGLIAHRRKWDEIEIIALVNRWDIAVDATVSIPIDEERQVELWRPIEGLTSRLLPEEGQVVHVGRWEPGEAVLFIVGDADTRRVPPEPAPATVTEVVSAVWIGHRRNSNIAIPLQGRYPGAPWQNPRALQEAVVHRFSGASGLTRLTTEWRLDIEGDPSGDAAWSLIVDASESMTVKVNGEGLDLTSGKPSQVPGLRRVPVGPLVSGTNVIALTDGYKSPRDVTPPWIRGSFAMTTSSSGAPLLRTCDGLVPFGLWSRLGLPLYTGTIVYRAETVGRKLTGNERVRMRATPMSGACEVRVNGSTAGWLWRRHTELDLSEYWKEADLIIEVAVGGTYANALNAAMGNDEWMDYGLESPPVIEIIRAPDAVSPTEPSTSDEVSVAK